MASSATAASPAKSSLRDFFVSREWRGRPYLISPFWDFTLVGGLAFFVFVSLFYFFPVHNEHFAEQEVAVLGVMTWLSYLINDPHFMVSYMLLYRGFPAKLKRFRDTPHIYRRYLVAGIIAPAVMLLYFLYALVAQNMAMFAFALNLMLILVGWHYAKQGFGVFMMLSAMKKIYYTKTQRFLFLLNSYVLWACYSLATLSNPTSSKAITQTFTGIDYNGIHYFDMPAWGNEAIGGFFMGGLIFTMILAVWDRKTVSMTALIGYLSMYYLLFAASFHPMWILLYPAFHSMQYLMFVYAYKRGETQVGMEGASAEAARQIKKQLAVYVLTMVVLGVVFFTLAPSSLEHLFNPQKSFVFPMTAAFVLFINVHHYFIDNVIWRKEHTEIAKYLFHRR